ncbi:flagella accessory protein C [Halonotius sp. GCM10025705]
MSDLSSTVGTIREENTEISERVEEVEEDVRNLLTSTRW